MSQNNLDAAISSAVEKSEALPEIKEEVKEEPKEEIKEEVKEEATSKVTPDETEMAVSLFRALKDPARSADVIRLMAKEAGIIGTPHQAEEVKKTISEVVKEGLGEDYAFLADTLGPVIEKAVAVATEDIREKTERAAQEQEAAKIKTAIDRVMNKYADAEKHEAAILQLMDEIPPSAGSDPVKYFERLLRIAAGEKGVTLRLKSTAERLQNTRDNAAVRLAAEGGKSETSATKPATTMDLNQAIKTAMEELSRSQK